MNYADIMKRLRHMRESATLGAQELEFELYDIDNELNDLLYERDISSQIGQEIAHNLLLRRNYLSEQLKREQDFRDFCSNIGIALFYENTRTIKNNLVTLMLTAEMNIKMFGMIIEDFNKTSDETVYHKELEIRIEREREFLDFCESVLMDMEDDYDKVQIDSRMGCSDQYRR